MVVLVVAVEATIVVVAVEATIVVLVVEVLALDALDVFI